MHGHVTHNMSKTEDDLELYNQLVTRPYTDKRGFAYGKDDPIHASPCEHQATPMQYPTLSCEPYEDIDDVFDKGITHIDRHGNLWSGNFRGWVQHRQLL